MRLAAAALAALAVAGAAGCGGSGAPLELRGRHVYVRACRQCHTLTGHDTSATGGDLGVGHLDAADIRSFALQMPVRGRLSVADARAVAAFIVASRR